MPVVLKLRFPSGRYHATPWGRHVNEGVPEWPPSPWRLLRALVAVWRRTCPDLTEAQVMRVLEPLTPPPCFYLPPSRVAHTRHYVPLGKRSPAEIAGGGTALIFDTFVAVGHNDPLFIGWTDAELQPDDRNTLAKLLGNLTSLGRAEAWVQAELSDETVNWNCGPSQPTEQDPIPVLCPDPASAFDDEFYPAHDPKKLKKGLRPSDLLFDCPRWHLCLDTQTIHDRRWPRVPGSLWVNYSIRAEEVAQPPKVSAPRRLSATFVRFALDGPVLPLVTETLPLAEQIRAKLLRLCKSLHCPNDPRSAVVDLPAVAPAFWGKDESGKPLFGHRHAFFLPVDEDYDGRIDHIAIFTPMGLSSLELQAIDRLRTIPFANMKEPLVLALVGLGACEDFARSRLLGPSAVWESATPFLATRHLKRRGRKRDPWEWFQGRDGQLVFVQEMLREDLRRRDELQPAIFAGAEIESLEHIGVGTRYLRSHQFHLNRRKPGDDGGRRPHGAFRIRFPAPIQGPVAVGHSCHFGLGLFLLPSNEAGTGSKGSDHVAVGAD